MKLIELLFFIFPVGIYAQNIDTIADKKYEYFFGCNCCEDTVTLVGGKNNAYECRLYKQESILTCRKDKKEIWIRDLKTDFPAQSLPYLCFDLRENGIVIVSDNQYALPRLIVVNLKNGKNKNF